MLQFLAYTLKHIFDLEDDFNHQSNRKKTFFAQNPTKKKFFTHVLAVFVKNHILLYLTVKLTF